MTTTVTDEAPEPQQRQRIDREFVPDCPVGKLTPHPKNARDHDRDDIREGLTSNPQYKPVVAQRSTGYILAGNGTFLVATEQLHWPVIDAFFVDVDDAQALMILAADNKIGSRSGYNEDELAALLTEIAEAQGSLVGTGYDMDELEDLLAALAESGTAAVAAVTGEGLGAPAVLAEVPATDAAYAESDEETEQRAAKVATQTPMHAKGLMEVLMMMPEDDKIEFGNLVSAARQVLGSTLATGEVVLRGVRVLVAALDARHAPDTIDMATLLKAADFTDPDDGDEGE